MLEVYLFLVLLLLNAITAFLYYNYFRAKEEEKKIVEENQNEEEQETEKKNKEEQDKKEQDKEEQDEEEQNEEKNKRDKIVDSFMQSLKIRTAIILICPVTGILFLAISYFFRHCFMRKPVDLSDVMFSKEMMESAVHADEEKDRNMAPLEEALAVSDKHGLRRLLLDVLKGDVQESLTVIALALNSEDSETAHYAASVLQEVLNEFRVKIQTMRLDLIKLENKIQKQKELEVQRLEQKEENQGIENQEGAKVEVMDQTEKESQKQEQAEKKNQDLEEHELYQVDKMVQELERLELDLDEQVHFELEKRQQDEYEIKRREQDQKAIEEIELEEEREQNQSLNELDDEEEQHCYNLIVEMIPYMNSVLEQKVFTDMEQRGFVHQLDEICQLLYDGRKELMTVAMYESVSSRLLDIDDYERARIWGDRAMIDYPNELASYLSILRLLFKAGDKEKFFAVLDQLKHTDIVINQEILEIIRVMSG